MSKPVYVCIDRPEDYDDVCNELVIEDAIPGNGFPVSDVTDEVAALRSELETYRADHEIKAGNLATLRAQLAAERAKREEAEKERDFANTYQKTCERFLRGACEHIVGTPVAEQSHALADIALSIDAAWQQLIRVFDAFANEVMPIAHVEDHRKDPAVVLNYLEAWFGRLTQAETDRDFWHTSSDDYKRLLSVAELHEKAAEARAERLAETVHKVREWAGNLGWIGSPLDERIEAEILGIVGETP